MLGVIIHEVQRGEDRVVGSIRLIQGSLHAFPAGDPLLEEILRVPVRGNKFNPRPIRAQDDPLKFLSHLQYHYKSAYLRATAPQEM